MTHKPEPMTPEQILHFVDIHVGEPSPKYPLDNSDWVNFTRAIEAARDAQWEEATKQLEQSEREGWLRVIDEEMVGAHLGVANMGDSYDEAKQKLNSLICWHVSVATDPAVNGGLSLQPAPTEQALQRLAQLGQEIEAAPTENKS
jgi:hypothetical protein